MKRLKRISGAAMKKLRARAGETLAETLIAVLIAAVAVLMLAGMLSTSADMVHKSEAAFNDYYTANNALSTQSGTGATGKALLRDENDNSVYLVGSADANVLFYVNNKAPNSTPVISYKYNNSTP